ncbi:MAG: hypothetical protein IKV05_06230 [Bacteroidales bacterium]|nr:hypothetical protein [Bacteroidales bacterium]
MVATILWIAGIICCIWCLKDVWTKKNVDTVIKVLVTIGLLCFSWLGLAVYYFILKDRL